MSWRCVQKRAANFQFHNYPICNLTMLILAIDTSGKQGSVALARGDGRSFQLIEGAPVAGGTFSAQLAEEFWRAVSSAGLLNLHVVLHHGRNAHHIIEAIFKACARALRQAVEPDPRAKGVPSTKGVL